MSTFKKISFVAVVVALFGLVACSSISSNATTKNDPNIYLTLVNKTHQLPSDWEKTVKIITAKNCLDEEVMIEAETYEHFKALREDCLKAGVQIELDSVYRSVDEQQEIWDEWTEEYGIDYVKQYVAVPGFSEHHTGLAVDIFVMKDGQEIRENADMIADTEDFAKIHKLIAKHGFILHYLPGKEDITGYSYEPWHLRYVGSVNIAKDIMNQGITLEEYLGKVDKPNN